MSPKKKLKAPTGELVPRPNGAGALAQGGPPRARLVVRERAARYFDEHIETLNEIASDEAESTPDRINAIKALGSFGIGVKVESTVDERRLLVVEVVYEKRPVDE